MKNIDTYKKIRKIWNISPITKTKQSEKLYKRAKNKKEVATLIKEELR